MALTAEQRIDALETRIKVLEIRLERAEQQAGANLRGMSGELYAVVNSLATKLDNLQQQFNEHLLSGK